MLNYKKKEKNNGMITPISSDRFIGAIKLAMLVLYLVPLTIYSQNILHQKVDFIIEDLSIPEALMILSEASEIEISFDPALLDRNTMIDIHEIDVQIFIILEKCLKDQDVEYVIINNKIIVRSATFDPYYVSGFIKDEISGESISGASVQNLIHEDLVKSNAYGYYSMPIRDASSILLVTHPKFASSSIIIALPKPKLDIKLNSDLKKDSLLVVERLDYQALELYLSNEGYSRSSFQNSAEPDVLQNFDWRSSSIGNNEGQEPNSYWGGSPQHTSVFLDGVRLYRGRQAFGMFSGVNARLIKNQSNHQHLIPAKYSGNLSAVQALETNVGNVEFPSIDVGLNSLIANITIDAPIVKNNANFIISYRQNISDIWNQGWVDLASNRTSPKNNLTQNFGELYAKINIKIKKKHVLSLWHLQSEERLSNFSSHEYTEIHGPFDEEILLESMDSSLFDYNQQTTALNWQYAANPKMILNATFSYSALNDNKHTGLWGTEQLNTNPLLVSSRISQRSMLSQMEGKMSFDYFHNESHYMQFGLQTDLRKFSPGIFIANNPLSTIVNNFNDFTFNDDIFDKNTEIRMFFQDKITLKKINANVGITAGTIGTTDRNYFFAEPRMSFTYKANKKSEYSINTYRANQFHQSPNLIESNLPFDFLISTNFNNTPEKSWHVHVGHLRKITRYSTIAIDVFNKLYSDITKWDNHNILNSESVYIRTDNFHNFTSKYSNAVQGVDMKLISKISRYRITGRYGLLQSNLSHEAQSFSSNFNPKTLSQQLNINVNVNLSDKFHFGLAWTFKQDSDKNELPYYPGFGSLAFSEFETTKQTSENFLSYHRLDAFAEYFFKKDNGVHNIYLKIFNAYDQDNVVQYYTGDLNYVVYGQGLTPSLGYQYTWRKRKVTTLALN
ncbi:MAG: hypothetical protein ACI8XB_002198 [Patiriisocius sp.]|jgi:hypothetical protein